MIYANIGGESGWTEEEVEEAYEFDLATSPDTTGTFEEWMERQLDLGLIPVDVDVYWDEILPD